MEHIAFMRKSWGLTKKILSGEKIIESRWYSTKHTPWDRVHAGDTIYFKDSGDPVLLKAAVSDVIQIDNLTSDKVLELLRTYGKDDGISEEDIPSFYSLFRDKKYVIFIYIADIERVRPFRIDKTGYGNMASWIVIDDIEKIRV